MEETGTEIDIDEFMLHCSDSDEIMMDVENFYEIQAKPISSSPLTDIKSVATVNNTRLKMELQRQQLKSQEKREKNQYLLDFTSEIISPDDHQMASSMALTTEHFERSTTNHGGNRDVLTCGSLPISSSKFIATSDIQLARPLEVKTRLKNPTKFHFVQSQKRQLNRVNENEATSANFYEQNLQDQEILLKSIMNGSMDTSDYDDSVSLISVDSLLQGSFESISNNYDPDLKHIEEIIKEEKAASTLPVSTSPILCSKNPSGRNSASCPEPARLYKGGRVRESQPPKHLTPEEAALWNRDRSKKDVHNDIEKRRRYNINDRIEELGLLVPHNEHKVNKGSILKATVEYVKKSKIMEKRMKESEQKEKMLKEEKRKLALKLMEVDSVLKSHGITSLHNTQELISSVMMENGDALSDLISPPSVNSKFNSLQLKEDPMLSKDGFVEDFDEMLS